MDYAWKLNHLINLADQVEKRWKDNPESFTITEGILKNGIIHIKDIELYINLYTAGYVYIALRDLNGTIKVPSIFSFKNRILFFEAKDKLQKVVDEMRNGPPDRGDKLLCEAFPELFEKFLTVKKDG
jgi:hypothetical protein